MTNDPILVERHGSIATVVLNRPAKLNALTKAMWSELGRAVDGLSADNGVRCIVVRGAGERAFSPGNDIAEFATERANKAQAIAYGAAMHGTARALASCRHPLVAQIHGVCVGGGLEIAALCDLRICGESSRFGAPIKNLGLVMAYAEMAPLLALVGRAVMLELLLEGRILEAAEALAKGLVTRVVPDGDVAAEARATAQRIAEGAPLVARWHKKFARRLADPRPLSAAEEDECLALLDTAGVPAGPVHSVGEALTHPQTLARQMVVELEHPEAGPTRALGCPIHFSETPARVDRPAPRLGEHTRHILRECGYADTEIDALAAARIIAATGST